MQQRPPPVADVREGALAPADRRQPRQGAVADVAGGAQHVRGAEGERRPRRRPPGCSRTPAPRPRSAPAKVDADAGERGAEQDRAGRPAARSRRPPRTPAPRRPGWPGRPGRGRRPAGRGGRPGPSGSARPARSPRRRGCAARPGTCSSARPRSPRTRRSRRRPRRRWCPAARVGPLIATTAVLPPRVSRSLASSSGVSYRLWLCVDWTSTSSVDAEQPPRQRRAAPGAA